MRILKVILEIVICILFLVVINIIEFFNAYVYLFVISMIAGWQIATWVDKLADYLIQK